MFYMRWKKIYGSLRSGWFYLKASLFIWLKGSILSLEMLYLMREGGWVAIFLMNFYQGH